MAYMNKIFRFIVNSSKMTFTEKNKTFCVNIGIIRNLETKFPDENCYNYNNITFTCLLQSYISSLNEALVSL